MPGAKVHATCGAMAGFGSLIVTEPSGKPCSLAVILGRIAGGAVGGLLPDKLEPAIHPRHRKTCHSVSAGTGISSVVRFACTLDDAGRMEADKLRQIASVEPNTLMNVLNRVCAWIVEFLGSAFVGVIVGYLSHLALDFFSPASIPLI